MPSQIEHFDEYWPVVSLGRPPVSPERRDARAAFEAGRAKKLQEALHDLTRCRRLPWYQAWVKRVDRQKYRVNKDHPKGKYRDDYKP